MIVAKEMTDLADKSSALEKAVEDAFEQGHEVEYRLQLVDEVRMLIPEIEEQIDKLAHQGMHRYSPLGEYNSQFKKHVAELLRRYFSSMGFVCQENYYTRTIYGGDEIQMFETYINW